MIGGRSFGWLEHQFVLRLFFALQQSRRRRAQAKPPFAPRTRSFTRFARTSFLQTSKTESSMYLCVCVLCLCASSHRRKLFNCRPLSTPAHLAQTGKHP